MIYELKAKGNQTTPNGIKITILIHILIEFSKKGYNSTPRLLDKYCHPHSCIPVVMWG